MTHKLDILPVLLKTKTLLQRERADLIKSGESFNLFSVLGMERLENKTHSAFLASLLNPAGKHLKNEVFLKLFLNQLKDSSGDQFNFFQFDIPSAKVYTEYYIGKINKRKKTGGRIDIVIQDKKDNTISIENKIDAPDQDIQIQRYHNFNKDKNRVVYLTLDRSIPSERSMGNLIPNTHFKCISYQSDIIEWLNKCLTKVDPKSTLFNSIRQYILLLKKITNTMDKKEQQELIDLILDNYDESKYISKNFQKAHEAMGERLRTACLDKLRIALGKDWVADPGSKITSNFAQIWLSKNYKNGQLYYGIESFNGTGHDNGRMFIGVFKDRSCSLSVPKEKQFHHDKSNWFYRVFYSDYMGNVIQISNADTLKKLHSNDSFFEGLVNHLVQETQAYIKMYDKEIMELNANIAS